MNNYKPTRLSYAILIVAAVLTVIIATVSIAWVYQVWQVIFDVLGR